MLRFFIPLFLMVILSGCTKEYDSYPFTQINFPVNSTLRDIAVIDNDNWLISGGESTLGFVAKTSNAGLNWQVIAEPFDNSVNCLFFINEDTGYAGDEDILIYKTENGGNSWSTYYSNSWPLTVNRNLRDFWFTNDSTGFVCGGKNLGNGVMYQTVDAGNYWSYTQYDHEYRGICFTDELHGVMCGYGSLLITADGGNTFTITDNYDAFYTGICKNTYNELFICDFNGTVISSADAGNNWKKIREGSAWNTKGSYLNSIDVSDNGRIVCAGPNGFLTWSNDGGNSWNNYTTFNGTDILKVKWLSSSTVIAAGKNGGVFTAVL